MNTVTVSSESQVVIPSVICEAMNLMPGEELQVMRIGTRVELIPVRPIQEMRGFLRGMNTEIEEEADCF